MALLTNAQRRRQTGHR
ncbi:hypothetical protein E2C01_024762 [Portunus trituberculatus]|uniref:Uncharacterized protein n=1 Tax=Portunus trituberculatus TaxID=210409 RepID=A0A5B7EBE6_PORTR|nr:hypothetical protein [Portunus trituberculatus]